MNTQVFFGAISGILSFCLLAIKNTPGVIAFSALYGFVSGPFVSLPIPVITSVSPDKSILGIRLGMSFAFSGFGVLIGEPVAGAILGSSQNWVGVIIWSGVMLLASSFIISAARIVKDWTGPHGKELDPKPTDSTSIDLPLKHIIKLEKGSGFQCDGEWSEIDLAFKLDSLDFPCALLTDAGIQVSSPVSITCGGPA